MNTPQDFRHARELGVCFSVASVHWPLDRGTADERRTFTSSKGLEFFPLARKSIVDFSARLFVLRGGKAEEESSLGREFPMRGHAPSYTRLYESP